MIKRESIKTYEVNPMDDESAWSKEKEEDEGE